MPRSVKACRDRDERGAVAIVVAALMTGLLIITAMVLDFGLLRVDRQIDRAAADDATLAGLHGLNTGDGTPHSYVGVCTAAQYLVANGSRFAAADPNLGWTDGNGANTANGCSDSALRNKVCNGADKSSWARWHWQGTYKGVGLKVWIESGYDLAANNGWREDSLPATSGDNGDTAKYGGCDNLAVTIEQERDPGLGSLATSSDLRTGIRSVGRIKAIPGDSAPAMLLLKRTGCPVLKTGSSGGSSFVHVLGALSSNGSSQGGTIHSDSDGVGCAGNNNGWVYGGLANNGIVAFAAPLASNPLAADVTKPGMITSVAAANGITGNRIRDALDWVYSSSTLGLPSSSKTEVTGRSLVTRGLVDTRYFPGVKPAIAGASSVFASGASGPPAGWVTFPASVNHCRPTQAEINALSLTASSQLYVNCVSNAGFVGPNSTPSLTINAGRVFFRGVVSPGLALRLPNAHHVYVANNGTNPNQADAITVSNGTSFEMHTTGNLDGSGSCSSGQNANKSVLFVRGGRFKQTGGLLRMCRTTTMMLGGRTDGCVPATSGAAPTATPCASTTGTGQFSQNGGDIDWTAPDSLDATTDPVTGIPLPAALTAWSDPNGPEDLALWSESGTTSSDTYGMAGGGLFKVRGVFMVPNAEPFIISGGSSLNLTNAQYIATSIELNGNTTQITMSVDPNSAVTLPDQGLVGLVR